MLIPTLTTSKVNNLFGKLSPGPRTSCSDIRYSLINARDDHQSGMQMNGKLNTANHEEKSFNKSAKWQGVDQGHIKRQAAGASASQITQQLPC